MKSKQVAIRDAYTEMEASIEDMGYAMRKADKDYVSLGLMTSRMKGAMARYAVACIILSGYGII